MKKNILFALVMAAVALTACFVSCENHQKDLTPPAIDEAGFLPADCDIYYLGDILQVRFTCSDDNELGNFNIEIHNNFDHHTHGTSSVDCDDDEGEHHHDEGEHHHDDDEEDEHHHHEVEGAWVFNRDYAIPAGLKEYTASIDIPVPDDVLEGDYHFMLRLTDRAGWQTLKAVAIHLKAAE